jgi:hypothetical protein
VFVIAGAALALALVFVLVNVWADRVMDED